MITISMWGDTNKKKIIAILFSVLLTPFAVLVDLLPPMIFVNGTVLFMRMWDSINS